MSAHDFIIPVTDLDAAGKQYEFPVKPVWVRAALEDHEASAAATDGLLAVRASKSGHDVVIHGTLDAAVTVPCARCTEPYEQLIHSDISVIFVPGKVKQKAIGDDAEGYELTEEEADTFVFDGERVVLDDLVRDELVLEVPMIPLCSDSCPGISPPPESDASASAPAKDIDPRLAPLLRFQSKAKK